MTDSLREEFHKPVVVDELGYEGNIQFGWGNLTAEEELRRFWETALRGGYPGHGETYLDDSNILWWSHGGKLHGESYKRFGFLKKIMEEVPGCIAPLNNEWDSTCAIPQTELEQEVKSQYLFYYGFQRPGYRDFYIDDETEYAVEVLDTWDMTIRFAGVFHGKFRITLPSKQYMAVRLTLASEADKIREVDTEYRSYRLKEEHPFIKEETNEKPFIDLEEKKEIEPMEMDADDYLEPTVIKEKVNELNPFQEEDEVFDNDLDEELVEEVNTVEEESLGFDDLVLPEPEVTEDDELPAIVTGSIPSFIEKRSQENAEDKKEHTSTLDIPIIKFFKR